MRARKVDDDSVGRSLERRGPLVIEAPEDELGAGAGASEFETNAGTPPFRRGSSALAG